MTTGKNLTKIAIFLLNNYIDSIQLKSVLLSSHIIFFSFSSSQILEKALPPLPPLTRCPWGTIAVHTEFLQMLMQNIYCLQL